jgi:uncharacterized membrane protein YfcA
VVEFSFAQWALFVIAVIVAFGVRGGAGFGGGVVAVPMLALIAPLQVVVPLTSALNTVASLSQGFRDWRKVEWREMARILPFALIGVVAGIFFLANIDPQPLSRAFGLFVVMYAAYALLSKGQTPAIPRRWLTPVAAVMSLCAGVIGSVFGGAAGPIFVIYLNSLKVEKDRFRATMTMLMLTLGTTRLIGYVIAGMYTQKVLILLAIAIPLSYAGGFLGIRVAQRINQQLFNRVVSIVLLASGVILMLK